MKNLQEIETRMSEIKEELEKEDADIEALDKEFDGLVGLNNKNLSYDFYLPQYNLLIEYQGEQHEKPIDFTGKGMKYAKKRFQIQQEHDTTDAATGTNKKITAQEFASKYPYKKYVHPFPFEKPRPHIFYMDILMRTPVQLSSYLFRLLHR